MKEELTAKIDSLNEQLKTATPDEIAVIQKQISDVEHELDVLEWIEDIREKADKQAKDLSNVFGIDIVPAIFVVKELEDIAVAFIKQPDAKTGMKILRIYSENEDLGLELAAKAQLVRDSDLNAKGFDGSASDSRFMDANGKYDLKYSMLNMSLMLRMNGLIQLFADVFKKK